MNELKFSAEGNTYRLTNLNNGNKFDRAKKEAGEKATPIQVLAHYDKLAGYIQDKNGQKVENGRFWRRELERMEIEEKSLINKSEVELMDIMRNSIDNQHMPSSIFHKAKQELEFKKPNLERTDSDKDTILRVVEKNLTDLCNRLKNNFGKTILLILILITVIVLHYSILPNIFSLSSSSNESSKFSTTTSVYLRDHRADTNIINIDNIATMRPWGGLFGNPDPSNQIEMVLNFPITVLSDAMAPTSNGSAYSYKIEPDKTDIYIFNKTTQKSHEIKVGKKIYILTLFNIKDLSKNSYDINYEYQFGVKEK